ncbi:MAG: DUF4431 domain-containing protein [Oscillospiraceae bacterium]|nr:DUF4431 domain-containing protein [Oscillospiraceae bacterium]
MKKLLLAAALILAMPLFACKIGNLTTAPPAEPVQSPFSENEEKAQIDALWSKLSGVWRHTGQNGNPDSESSVFICFEYDGGKPIFYSVFGYEKTESRYVQEASALNAFDYSVTYYVPESAEDGLHGIHDAFYEKYQYDLSDYPNGKIVAKNENGTTSAWEFAGKTFEEAYGQNNSTNPPDSNGESGWFGGIVREGQFYHDGQEEWITYYYADVGEAQLETLKSKLADYEDLGEDPETEIHLYSTNGISLKDCVGKEIKFKGDYFACHTIHHRRNIVFEVKEIEINGIYGAAADADAPSPAAPETFETPFDPAFFRFDAPCWFNGHEIDGQNFAWDEFEDGSGDRCLMILVDVAAWDGAANDMLYLPGFGPPVVHQNENSIYLEWAYRSSGDGINLIFSDGSGDMRVAANELKGANYADTIKLPVSARKNGGSDSAQYYIPLYAILNEIGGGAARGIFGGETAYIYSGDPIHGQTGFWESGDQGEYRKDAVIGETTHSIVSYWNGLEFRPDGTFTFSDRYYQDGGDWVLVETIGRYVFFGRLLIMSYEEESEWRGPDYAALAPVKTGDSSNKYICCRYVEQWDGDYLDMRGYRYHMYGENLMQNAVSPKPGKSAG